jgi:hypothetical protein
MSSLEAEERVWLETSIELRRRWFDQIRQIILIVIWLTFLAFAGVQTGKFFLEKARIDAVRTAALSGANYSVTGIRAPSAKEITAQVASPLLADKRVSPGVYTLREMLEVLPLTLAKADSGISRTSVEWGKFAIAAIENLADAGQITLDEANSLREELLKPTIEVGVYASKAAVDRFISGKTSAESKVSEKAGVGAPAGNYVEITINATKEHVAIVGPKRKPKPLTQPSPCAATPVKDKNKEIVIAEASCKAS